MQELLILMLFTAAAAYLGWRAYSALSRQREGCGKGCGCAADKAVRTRQ